MKSRFRIAIGYTLGAMAALVAIGALTLTPDGHAPPQINLIPFAIQARGLEWWVQGKTGPWALRDLVGNAVLYAPFAACLCAALRQAAPQRRAGWIAIGVSCAISMSIEIAQSHIPGRYTDITDVMMNTTGALGAVAAQTLWRAKHGKSGTIVSFSPRTMGQKSGSMKAG